MEMMTEEEIVQTELRESGTSWTRNQFFDDNGFLYLKNIFDSEKLYHPLPDERGQLNYWDRNPEHFNHVEVEKQVEGSLARYWHPQYRKFHSDIRIKLEDIIGRKLYNTYYYDRFYFPGQKLDKHTDRAACEISISIHISSNIKEMWPFFIKSPDVYEDNVLNKGNVVGVNMEPGDGVLYKGCERPHWRDSMPGTLEMMHNKSQQLYYHQIFFHYVLQDGIRAHHAWDKCN